MQLRPSFTKRFLVISRLLIKGFASLQLGHTREARIAAAAVNSCSSSFAAAANIYMSLVFDEFFKNRAKIFEHISFVGLF